VGGAFDVEVPHRILKGFYVLTCGEELFKLFLLLVVGWDVAVVVLPPLLQVPLKGESREMILINPLCIAPA
jgi:hypothetical protein